MRFERLHVLIDGREVGEYRDVDHCRLQTRVRDNLLIDRFTLDAHRPEYAEIWTPEGQRLYVCELRCLPVIIGFRPDGEPVYAIAGGSPLSQGLVETFTATGAATWTNPGAGTMLAADAYGAGGGGGQSSSATASGGGGGGGQEATTSTPFALHAAQTTENYFVGAGGTIGTSGTNTAGGHGGGSWFSNTGVQPTDTTKGVYAPGSNGGGGASGISNGAGGSSGDSGVIGNTTHLSGNGAAGATTSGGGGAGGSGKTGNGAAGSGSTGGAGGAGNGGAGGNGATATLAATASSTNGGGGGGGTSTKTATVGSRGAVVIAYYVTQTNLGTLIISKAVHRAASW